MNIIYERIIGLLIEGETTGGNMEATFERLGKRRGHELKREREGKPPARRGEPGYLRKMFPRNVNPDFPGEIEAQKERKHKLANRILKRARAKEEAKNRITRANRHPNMGSAENLEDMKRQEREKMDFATSMGDTSYLNRKGLNKYLRNVAKSAKDRGKASVLDR